MCSLRNQINTFQTKKKKIGEAKGSYGEVNLQTHITDKLPNRQYVLHEAEFDLKNERHRLKPVVK